jgi:hypothetical protein
MPPDLQLQTPSPAVSLSEPSANHVPRDKRHVTILLVGRLITAAGDALARIRNVSAGGLMLEAGVPLVPGDKVRVELRTVQAVEGTIAWATAPRAGIRFDAPADVAQLLHPAAAAPAVTLPPRPPRLATCCPVQLCHQGRSRYAVLADLSQGGGHVQELAGAVVGDQLGVAIPGMPTRRAVVRWVRGGDAGFIFLEPLPFVELAAWLQNRTLRFAADDGTG